MTSVFLIGAGGVGKTTLVELFLQKSKGEFDLIKEVARKYIEENGMEQRDLKDKQNFWDLQIEIIKAQIDRENDMEGKDYISDRSIIDALTYSVMSKPSLFPLLKPEGREIGEGNDNIIDREAGEDTSDIIDHVFGPLLGSLQGEDVEDDGVRLTMTPDELGEYTELCRRILGLLRIPFLDMQEKNLDTRAELLSRALGMFVMPSPLASLEHYANITKRSNKVDRKAVDHHFHSLNFSFYRMDKKENATEGTSVPFVFLSNSEVRQEFLRMEKGKVRRFFEVNDISRLFKIEFHIEIPSAVVYEILIKGVLIQGAEYHFLGCTSGDLRRRACYLWKGDASDAEAVRMLNGEFNLISEVSKRIARFSLLLSIVIPTPTEPMNVIEEPDVMSRSGGNFTDGCGGISPDLAVSLYRSARCVLGRKSDRLKRLPSVFQIRYQGLKGVVVTNSSLRSSSLVTRPSMIKFRTTRFPQIAVCDYSRPFSYGHLNRQFIMLLSGLGVDDEIFTNIQKEHYDRIRRMLTDRNAALMLLEWRGWTNDLIDVDLCATGTPPFWCLRSLQRQLIVNDSLKLRILIPKSRTLFGVAETPRFRPEDLGNKKRERILGRLKSGECLIRLTMRGDKQFSIRGDTVVSKNPCYLLGDIRVLRAVSSADRPELWDLEKDLIDCIVFPIEGERPHSEEIAGSDLDGDKYFVCWDQRLIPPQTRPSYHYPSHKGEGSAAQPKRPTGVSANEAALVYYYSIQNIVSSTTGRVDSFFRAWADISGVDCEQCERCGQLFSRVVDSAKSGETIKIPESLAIPKEKRSVPSGESRFIWQRMEYAARMFLQEREQSMSKEGALVPTLGEGIIDPDSERSFLSGFVSRNHLGMTEFTKFRLIMRYLDSSDEDFLDSEFLQHVNFALFSATELGFAVAEYGLKPIMVENALLCHSRLVGTRLRFLEKFKLNSSVPWNFYWRDNIDSTAIVDFPIILSHALRRNTDVMLLLEVPDGVVVILRLSRIQQACTQDLLDSSKIRVASIFCIAQAYLISGRFGKQEKYDIGDDSYLFDLSPKGLQIYRAEHRQTFIHLKIDVPPTGSHSINSTNAGEVASVLMSVDLNRFDRRIFVGKRQHPPIRKVPVSGVEMFVYNRRSNLAENPARGIAYLDVLFEDSGSERQRTVEEDSLVSEYAEILKLIPTGDELLKKLEHEFLDILGEQPMQSMEMLRSLLQLSCQMFGLCIQIDKQVAERINLLSHAILTKAIPSIELSGALLSLIIDLAALLCDLGSEFHLIIPRPQTAECALEILPAILECFRRWDTWAIFAATGKSTFVRQWLESLIDPSKLSPLDGFVLKNGFEQLDALLCELKDNVPKAGDTAFVSRVSDLRVDSSHPTWENVRGTEANNMAEPLERQNLPTITLYRVHSIPQRLPFTVGEYVRVTIQTQNDGIHSTPEDDKATTFQDDYDLAFPPLRNRHPSGKPEHAFKTSTCRNISKLAGYCLGRVVTLCEAPFAISLKIVAPSYGMKCAPEFLLNSLRSQPRIFWEVTSVPANVVTHIRNMDAISAFISQSPGGQCISPNLLPFLINEAQVTQPDASMFGTAPALDPEGQKGLNLRQKEAVSRMLDSTVSLVHGPGGTGKTCTAVQMMLTILERSDHRLLVCAETRLACDNLALRFLCETEKGYFPIRVGRVAEETKNADLLDIGLETMVRKRVKPKPRQEFFLGKYKRTIAEVLAESRIVFATCAGSGDPVLNNQTFESVIMDEASMTTEPAALTPLARGCCHLVMIGDHKQLGPHANDGLSCSLFERLSNKKDVREEAPMTFLNVQHRMHPQLCSFPSRMFYDSKLLTAADMGSLRIPPTTFFKARNPFRFVDVPNGREARIKRSSWYNEVEIDRLLEILDKLLGDDSLDASKITVLTFYRAQQLKIRESLSNWNKPAPEVSSVDGFQGKENEVIVASTVRSGNVLGFCDNERRLNVLFTRAKRGLVVIGRRDTLKLSPIWSAWLQDLKY
eukprot:scaffold4223_cov189-Amphora_coffeaeformis.AAC.9